MLRKLLACLALLTGLAAAGAPARAEVAVALASRMEASCAGVAPTCRQTRAAPARPAIRREFAMDGLARSVDQPAVPARAVRLGCDRARE